VTTRAAPTRPHNTQAIAQKIVVDTKDLNPNMTIEQMDKMKELLQMKLDVAHKE
jgi:hypothetical protein